MSSDEPVGEKLARIETKLDAALNGFRDHETRIRTLEEEQAQQKGGRAMLAFAASAFGGLLVGIIEYFTNRK
jgi:hypothetical protein